MEEDVAVLALGQSLAQGRDGALGRLVAGVAALDDPRDLGQLSPGDDLLDVGYEAGRHEHDDVVDVLGVLEDGQRVLDDRLAYDLQQLLGDRQSHALPGATGEYDRGGPGLGFVRLRHRRPTLL